MKIMCLIKTALIDIMALIMDHMVMVDVKEE